jgi:hypothetical protein
MTQYKYLWFVKWNRPYNLKKLEEDPEYGNKWFTKHADMCKKHGVKLLFRGAPYGTPEQALFCMESEKHLDEFQKVLQEFYTIDNPSIEYAKTILVTPPS